ncbi:MAG: MopE-related protein, partial [Myxococcota bacterium]
MTLLLLLACTDNTLGKADRPPTVDIVTPIEDGAFDPSEMLVFCAQVADEDELSELRLTLQSSVDGVVWTSDDGGAVECDGGNVGLELPLSGTDHTLSLTAEDTSGQTAEDTVHIVPYSNGAPSCDILEPTDGEAFGGDVAIPFTGYATDPDVDSAELSAVLASDLAGELWSGSPDSTGAIEIPDLALQSGDHLLTLTVTDPQGLVDVCGASILVDRCADEDGDGVEDCDGDCDDGDATIYPGAPEELDGDDDDCNGTVDDGTVLVDDDGDGFTEVDGDCDDADAAVNPDATETWYDGVDDDCDGNDDDRDGDGFAVADDCDDGDPAVNPVATEVWYDGVDDDCDGNDDDQDGDGYAV